MRARLGDLERDIHKRLAVVLTEDQILAYIQWVEEEAAGRCSFRKPRTASPSGAHRPTTHREIVHYAGIDTFLGRRGCFRPPLLSTYVPFLCAPQPYRFLAVRFSLQAGTLTHLLFRRF
jgi:hypothetical protein